MNSLLFKRQACSSLIAENKINDIILFSVLRKKNQEGGIKNVATETATKEQKRGASSHTAKE